MFPGLVFADELNSLFSFVVVNCTHRNRSTSHDRLPKQTSPSAFPFFLSRVFSAHFSPLSISVVLSQVQVPVGDHVESDGGIKHDTRS